MARSCPRTTPGVVYILHFSRPLAHASHYGGWALVHRLDQRIDEHLAGRGSRLVAAAVSAGIEVGFARAMMGTLDDERRIKRGGHLRNFCPECCEALGLRLRGLPEDRSRPDAESLRQARRDARAASQAAWRETQTRNEGASNEE